MKKNLHGNRFAAVASDGAVDWDHPLNANKVLWMLPGLPGLSGAGSRVLNLADPKCETNGTLSAGASWSGRSLKFDGTSTGMVTVPDFSGVDIPTFTWFIRATVDGNGAFQSGGAGATEAYLAFKYNAGQTQGAGFYRIGTTLSFYVINPTSVNSSGTIAVGTEFFAVGTYDNAAVKLYLNGTLAQSTAQSGAVTWDSSSLYLGRSNRSYDAALNGRIKEFGIIKGAQSASQVAVMTALSNQGYRTPDSPLRWISTRTWFVPSVAPASITMLPELFVSA